VLDAARDRPNARIAAGLRVTVDTVRKWRDRFAELGLLGLADLAQAGQAAADQRARPGGGGGVGLPAVGRDRGAAVSLDQAGAGRRADGPGPCQRADVKPEWDQQAVDAAKGYLSLGQGFSRSSLLQQLTSSYGNGFTQAQAQYAVDKVMPS
jgi:hypothetical protein